MYKRNTMLGILLVVSYVFGGTSSGDGSCWTARWLCVHLFFFCFFSSTGHHRYLLGSNCTLDLRAKASRYRFHSFSLFSFSKNNRIYFAIKKNQVMLLRKLDVAPRSLLLGQQQQSVRVWATVKNFGVARGENRRGCDGVDWSRNASHASVPIRRDSRASTRDTVRPYPPPLPPATESRELQLPKCFAADTHAHKYTVI